MNCEKCQELLSEFIDGDLNLVESLAIKNHLAQCEDCAEIYDDFSAILNFCEEKKEIEIAPPNSQALWCRISNVIENEVKPQVEAKPQPKAEKQLSFWQKSWQFSLMQTVAAVLAITIVSSLLTVVIVKNIYLADETIYSTNGSLPPMLFERFLGKIGIIETPIQTREKKLKEQQAAIDYWNKRVEARKLQWNKHLRESFDRYLFEIDQVVNEYTQILEENPQDEISGEMLDTALSEKVELLREFSEL